MHWQCGKRRRSASWRTSLVPPGPRRAQSKPAGPSRLTCVARLHTRERVPHEVPAIRVLCGQGLLGSGSLQAPSSSLRPPQHAHGSRFVMFLGRTRDVGKVQPQNLQNAERSPKGSPPSGEEPARGGPAHACLRGRLGQPIELALDLAEDECAPTSMQIEHVRHALVGNGRYRRYGSALALTSRGPHTHQITHFLRMTRILSIVKY